MVGINTIKMSSDYSNVEGLGFAIPSASIRRLVNDLLTYGEVRPEPSFGVTVLQTGTRLEDDIWGLQVLEVTPGSAADLAGIREGTSSSPPAAGRWKPVRSCCASGGSCMWAIR